MGALLEAQKQGKDIGDASRLDMDAAEIQKTYPEDVYPRHAAWLNWPWKLHSLTGAKFVLYDLESDPNEENDIADQHPDRVKEMKTELQRWQSSVLRSLNGKDYR